MVLDKTTYRLDLTNEKMLANLGMKVKVQLILKILNFLYNYYKALKLHQYI